MKVIVYLVCIAVAAMVQTALKMSGVQLGGLPVVLLYGAALAASTSICRALARKKANPDTPNPDTPKQKWAVELWYTCPKCGQLVRDGEVCDCKTLCQQPDAIDEPERRTEDTAAPVQKSPRRKALVSCLCVVSSALLLCTCYLEYQLDIKAKAVNALAAENAALAQWSENKYIASAAQDTYHRSSCKYAKNIVEGYRIYYSAKAAAECDGKTACSLCRP